MGVPAAGGGRRRAGAGVRRRRRRGLAARDRRDRGPHGGRRARRGQPVPRQESVTAAERLVQPLLQWSWLTFLPLGPAERSPRESLVAANGQLLAVRTDTYRDLGGYDAVAGDVLDDVALFRAAKRAGRRVAVVDGTGLATCRMYDGWPQLRDGYTKSLWAAFGSPAGAAGVAALLTLLYVVPPAAALTGRASGSSATPRASRAGAGRPAGRVPGLARRARPPAVRRHAHRAHRVVVATSPGGDPALEGPPLP